MSGRRGIFRDRRAGGERVSIVPQKRKTRADPDPDWVMKNEPEEENPEFTGSSKVLAKSVVKPELLTRWEWLNDGDMWMVYASEHNIQINQALNTGKKTLKLSLGPGVSLQVDISKMIQINSKTGYQRQVRLAVKEQDQYFVWQWQSDEGYWVSYDANSCILLELALQADEKFVSLDLNDTHYTVDLGAMVQKNTQTQREREIQRCLSVAEDEEGEQLENVVEESITAKRPRRSVKIEEDSKEHVRTLLLKGKAPIDPECSSKIGKAHVFCEGDDVYDVMLNQDGITRQYEHHHLGEGYQYQLQERSQQYHCGHSIPTYNAQHDPQVPVSDLAPSESFENESVVLRQSPDYTNKVPAGFLEIDDTEVQASYPQRKSTVWDFFHLKDPSIGIRNATSAFCNLCTREVKRGSTPGRLGTTAMRNHLAKHHHREWSATGTSGIITAPSAQVASSHHSPVASTSKVLPQAGLPLLRSALDICYCFFATVCTLCGAVVSQGETVHGNREHLMLQHMQSSHCSILRVSLNEIQGSGGVDDNSNSSL